MAGTQAAAASPSTYAPASRTVDDAEWALTPARGVMVGLAGQQERQDEARTVEASSSGAGAFSVTAPTKLWREKTAATAVNSKVCYKTAFSAAATDRAAARLS
jgi:hypothetical protein